MAADAAAAGGRQWTWPSGGMAADAAAAGS